MKALEYIEKTREYLSYLEEHIKNVEKAFKIISDKCSDMRFIYDDFYYHQLRVAVEYHDISKLYNKELIQYRMYFYPTNSESQYDRKRSFNTAWKHHQNNNDHHWENWTRLQCSFPGQWEIWCAHMVIDWMAMSMKFGDTPQQYYEKNKANIDLPDYAIDFINEIFEKIK